MASNLFVSGDVTLHSGAKSSWLINADSLSDADLATLAHMAASILPPFGRVEGVPRGGLRFAEALRKCSQGYGEFPVLICDDVLSTGQSMEKQRAGRAAVGVVIFARDVNAVPFWITPLFIFGATEACTPGNPSPSS